MGGLFVLSRSDGRYLFRAALAPIRRNVAPNRLNFLFDSKPGSHAPGFFRVLTKETTLSKKIEFIVWVKGLLNRQLETLLAASDAQGAQNVQRFLGTQDHIHDSYFNSIAPSFEPLSSKLMLAIQVLNSAIVSGTSSPANYNEYALAVLAGLQS